jgi:hypothetical protein
VKKGGQAASWAGLGMERPRFSAGAPLFLILAGALIVRMAMAVRVVPDRLFDFDSMGLVTPRSVELKCAYGDDWLLKATVDFAADVVIFYQWNLDAMHRSRDPDASGFWQTFAQVDEFHWAESPIAAFFRRDIGSGLLPSVPPRPGDRPWLPSAD